MTINPTSGLILWTPNAGQVGPHSVTVKVTDSGGLSDTQSFIILVSGGGIGEPSITSIPPTSVVKNTQYSYNVDATDPGDTLTFSLDAAPSDMTINPTSGLILWTPNAGQVGPHSVTVKVTDSGGLSDTQSFIINVSGDCLIATATYGSAMAPQVQELRELRDGTILKTASGSALMTGFNAVYYTFSPTIADWENQNPVFKEAVKITITPLLSTLSILKYVDINSEAEMLVYVISVILLNIGMYFVAPAVVIMRLRYYTRKEK